MIRPPCLNCPDRAQTCHDTCERYRAFAEAKRREGKALTEGREAIGLRIDSMDRQRRGYRAKKRIGGAQ